MPATVFVVRRKVNPICPLHAIPSAEDQYVVTFDTREAAEEHARQLDRAEWPTRDVREFKPFGSFKYEQLTTLPNYALRDWLRDGDIQPPSVLPKKFLHREQQTWEEWWATHAASWNERQRVRVWEGLNLYRLYEVVEVPAGEPDLGPVDLVVFAVVHRDWEYMDYWYRGRSEARAVFRTRQRAEQERQRMEEARRVDPERDGRQHGPDEFVIVELLIQSEG